MWSTVELREIRVFLTLAEELHFGRTGERLQLTQSRVSQIIRELETKVGRKLLHRTSRRVELTEFGGRFRDELGEAYEQLVRVLQRAQPDRRRLSGPLGIGLFSDPAASLIPRIARAFERAFPESTVQAAEVPLEDPFRPLRTGEVDLVASWLPHGQPGLVVGPVLSCEPRVLAVSSEHPLSGRSHVSIEDVADYRVMRFETLPREFNEEWIPSTTPNGRLIQAQPFSDPSLGDRGRMTNELVYQIATGRVVHPTVPSFANMFGHPDIAYVPISDMRPLCSALVWLRENCDERVREFARIAEAIATS